LTSQSARIALLTHDKIDYVLTEVRVMLPGAQALLGFQPVRRLSGARPPHRRHSSDADRAAHVDS
jgi:hypothetical protein